MFFKTYKNKGLSEKVTSESWTLRGHVKVCVWVGGKLVEVGEECQSEDFKLRMFLEYWRNHLKISKMG